MKEIKNVTLIKIRKPDAAMLFRWDDKHPTLGTSLWLTGWNRPSNAKRGDTGKLVYRSGAGYGLWFFERGTQ